MKLLRFLYVMLVAITLTFFLVRAVAATDLENALYLDLKNGRVVIELFPEHAPNHVARIKQLTRAGFLRRDRFSSGD